MNEYNGLPMTPVREEPRSSRSTSSRYADTIRFFWEGEPTTQAIDFKALDIKGQTLRVGLLKAIDDAGLTGKIKVSVHESTGIAYISKVTD